ncbi:MAG: hypothetical protein ACLRM8_00620 [Alistipes sp.]
MKRSSSRSFGYENGVYDIEVNLNTMKMTLTAKASTTRPPIR